MCGFIGESRKVGFAGGFLLSLLLTPVVWFIVAMLSPEKEVRRKVVFRESSSTKSESDSKSIGDQLKQLHELKESGAITQDEFEAAKAKLLA